MYNYKISCFLQTGISPHSVHHSSTEFGINLYVTRKHYTQFLKAGNKKNINALKYGNMTKCENSG